mmetsp:Transcript_98458/g.211049  ORF Transcript_98458/g.211049 Transcript_98458/m.211049 type:complete len:235 (-) Transcript_98458:726-1430(-)
MPALAMVTHCCSIASWMATRSFSPILSNSSMQMAPRSARTMAPASRLNSLLPASLIIAAVRPAPLEPRPVVLTASSDTFITKRSICDFPQEGSPMRRTLISPRKWVPLERFFSVPPTICKSNPSFTFSWPQIDGAKERARRRKASGRWAIFLMLLKSSLTKDGSSMFLTSSTLVAISRAGQMPLVKSWSLGGKERYTPVIWTRSPGLQRSTRSPSTMTSTLRGICPAGVCSGPS